MITVVGAALIRDARVLAGRRTAPAAAAGRWEFPGGKVAPGEQAEAALVREVAEELGCQVRVEDWLVGAAPIGMDAVLRVAAVRLVSGEPSASQHDRLRWLRADELGDIDWLEPDRPFLDEVAYRLLTDAGRPSGALMSAESATAVVAGLRRGGWCAGLRRRAGDDGVPVWLVASDAPDPVIELAVDGHDGWFEGTTL